MGRTKKIGKKRKPIHVLFLNDNSEHGPDDATLFDPGGECQDDEMNKDVNNDDNNSNEALQFSSSRSEEPPCSSSPPAVTTRRGKNNTKEKPAWYTKFKQLQAYKSQYGNCLVPQRGTRSRDQNKNSKDLEPLGRWVQKQREQYRTLQRGKRAALTKERRDLLDEIGFVWEVSKKYGTNSVWDMRYEQLKLYKAQHGDCLVPQEFVVVEEDDNNKVQLGEWVANQRRQHSLLEAGKRSTISKERLEKLNKIGFVWKKRSCVKWEDRFDDLLKYKQERGDCLVPAKYDQHPSLAKWVTSQRGFYKMFKAGEPTSITQHRIDQLDGIGFVWKLNTPNYHINRKDENKWEVRLKQLKEYKKEHGDCLVPYNYDKIPSLGKWVTYQRSSYNQDKDGKTSSLTLDRICQLEEIGFVWRDAYLL